MHLNCTVHWAQSTPSQASALSTQCTTNLEHSHALSTQCRLTWQALALSATDLLGIKVQVRASCVVLRRGTFGNINFDSLLRVPTSPQIYCDLFATSPLIRTFLSLIRIHTDYTLIHKRSSMCDGVVGEKYSSSTKLRCAPFEGIKNTVTPIIIGVVT